MRTLVKLTDFGLDTPERSLAQFLLYWQLKKWKGMVMFSQAFWQLEFAKRRQVVGKKKNISTKLHTPAGWIETVFDQKELLNAEIIEARKISECFVEITCRIKYILHIPNMKPKTFIKYMKANVIRENRDGQCTGSGTWGVNPASCLREADLELETIETISTINPELN